MDLFQWGVPTVDGSEVLLTTWDLNDGISPINLTWFSRRISEPSTVLHNLKPGNINLKAGIYIGWIKMLWTCFSPFFRFLTDDLGGSGRAADVLFMTRCLVYCKANCRQGCVWF